MKIFFVTLFVFISFIYGVAVGTYKIFPFQTIIYIKSLLIGDGVKAVDSEYYKNKVDFFNKYHRKDYDAVFVGDSLIDIAEWDDIFTGKNIANRGISGDTTKGIFNRMSSITNINSKKYLLMFGVNDIISGINVNISFENYKKIIYSISTKEKVTIFVVSTILTNNKKYNIEINHLNNLISKYCYELNVKFIDVNKSLASDGVLLQKYTIDGTHLNANGYAILSEIINNDLFL
ncbi:GDSL-type esterase/lipase family protein [Shewanella baltica]|uniref:GDSL-type esterase/lipase family protein n=1 Tax=Shewanella baltica TaxID=62322 RepID=UPI00217DCEAB|nr:GDSL-type esterase/lipase family protein [Shewanella baltica]MCS6101380.1 hypothetical protein [Shewanella baltica]MCS6184468.1 hypothetical protein [Shewanella baltica]